MRDRTAVLNLNTKAHTGLGVASFILSLIAIVFIIAAIWVSSIYNREIVFNKQIIGISEVISFVVSIGGLALGVAGETTIETIKKYSHIGIVINGILIIIHIIVFANGY